MAITAPNSPAAGPSPAGTAAPVERADPIAAAKQGSSSEDRAGFDLGGAAETAPGPAGDDVSPPGSAIIPGGSKNPVPAGTDAASTAGSIGMSDGASRSPGGPAGGSRPGEANQATAGAVRPPQSTGADQTFSQGNPDDAA